MCLHIRSGPHIAEKDIPVFKVIWDDNRSHYTHYTPFVYAPNKIYENIDVQANKLHRIEEGYHAFRYGHVHWAKTTNRVMTRLKYCLRSIAPDSAHCVVQYIYARSKLVAFTIPKGATYYLGVNGDIVASSIKSGSLKAMRPRDLKRKRKVIV